MGRDVHYGGVLAAGLFCAALCPARAADFPDAASLPPRPELPDPLVFLDGRPVASAREWREARRPELKALFQHYMYGEIPPRPPEMEFKVGAVHQDALGGKARLKLVEVRCGPAGAPRMDLLVIVPNARSGPVPVFLALNFCGNHAVIADPRVPLSRGWVYSSCKGSQDGRATDAAHGAQAADWAVEETVARGYALATFCSADIDADRAGEAGNLPAWFARPESRVVRPGPQDRGSIALWAFGFHRAVDDLEPDPEIDAARIAAVGHSRNGKTALLAAAFDERIALAIPHQAGCGGTSPSRGKVGESVEQINKGFPHWFNGEFKKFNAAPERLPFDQHALAALCAPRPVLFSNAAEDTWANPDGQFEVLRAAEPVYKLLGAGGLESATRPELGKLSGGKLGYYIRAGQHSMTREDWQAFLEFADRHLAQLEQKRG
jgi:hypothetical protein